MNEEEGDVWDDNSAYIEMLAKEVHLLPLPLALTDRGRLFGRRVNAYAKQQSEESMRGMVGPRTTMTTTRSKKN
jgi:hypothetical protein